MKAVMGAVALGVTAFVIWWALLSTSTQEKYLPIQIGYGNGNEKQIEMHTNVGVAMVAMDRRDDDLKKMQDLDEWVKDHFKLTDAAGKPVKMERQNNSKVIRPHQVLGTQEFFLVSKLKPGEEYTYDYKPRFREPFVFRYKFTAPAQAEKPSTYNFNLVK
jgi:hypothetical protein